MAMFVLHSEKNMYKIQLQNSDRHDGPVSCLGVLRMARKFEEGILEIF